MDGNHYETKTNKRRAGDDSHLGNGDIHVHIDWHSHCDFSLGILIMKTYHYHIISGVAVAWIVLQYLDRLRVW